MSKNKSILMLGTSLASPGGMTSVVRSLKDAGLFETCHVTYLATYEGGAILTQLRVMARAALLMLWRLATGSVVLVHAHSASRGSFWRKSMLCALARFFGVPYFFHVHSGEFPVFYHEECGSLARRWVRRTLGSANAVICLSDSWAVALRQIAPSARAVVIGNPVTVPEILPAMRENARNLLFLGRLREKKGVFDLIRAVPEIHRQCPGLRFILAGDEGAVEVRNLAATLGVEDLIDLPGWVDGAAKEHLLRDADIFVLPSYFEGLPVGILEAMATGIPIVSTPVGGIPDMVADGKQALLVPPGDAQALAYAIISLGRDPGLRERLREAAFFKVSSSYAMAKVVGDLSALYREHLQPEGAVALNREIVK